jgi:hypothetical protein
VRSTARFFPRSGIAAAAAAAALVATLGANAPASVAAPGGPSTLAVTFAQPVVEGTVIDFRFTGTAPSGPDQDGATAYSVTGIINPADLPCAGDGFEDFGSVASIGQSPVLGPFGLVFHYDALRDAKWLGAGSYLACAWLDDDNEVSVLAAVQEPFRVRKPRVHGNLHARVARLRTDVYGTYVGTVRVVAHVAEEVSGRRLDLRFIPPGLGTCSGADQGASRLALKRGAHTYRRSLRTPHMGLGRGRLCGFVGIKGTSDVEHTFSIPVRVAAKGNAK